MPSFFYYTHARNCPVVSCLIVFRDNGLRVSSCHSVLGWHDGCVNVAYVVDSRGHHSAIDGKQRPPVQKMLFAYNISTVYFVDQRCIDPAKSGGRSPALNSVRSVSVNRFEGQETLGEKFLLTAIRNIEGR